MNEQNWYCLDCRKNTLHTDDYYMLRNKLWREIVPREQRHGMLCLGCMAERLGRPLQPDDFMRDNDTIDKSDPDERPMDLDDYGIIDGLTDRDLAAIDEALVAEVSATQPTLVAKMIGRFMEHSPAAVPGLPDYFYLERVERMLDEGFLIVERESNLLMRCHLRRT